MMEAGGAKLRYALATNGGSLRTLGAVLFVLGVLGVVGTLLFPPTMAVTAVTDRSVVETETTTTATVEGDHAMYDHGEVLTDEPVYIRSVTPAVTVTATTQAPPDALAVDQQVAIVYAASSRTDGVFREREQVLSATSGTIETEGDPVESVVTLEIDDVAATLEAMRAEIGDAGEVDAFLRVETAYSGTAYDGRLEEQVELTVRSDSYRVPPLSTEREHRTTASSVVPVADEVYETTLPVIGGVVVPHTTPIAVGVSMLGIALFGGVRYGRRAVDADRERVRIHRRRYGEWISRGELPSGFAERSEVVTMASLEGLVDIAIDADSRVIHDVQEGCHAVLTDGVVYVFHPDPDGGFVFDATRESDR